MSSVGTHRSASASRRDAETLSLGCHGGLRLRMVCPCDPAKLAIRERNSTLPNFHSGCGHYSMVHGLREFRTIIRTEVHRIEHTPVPDGDRSCGFARCCFVRCSLYNRDKQYQPVPAISECTTRCAVVGTRFCASAGRYQPYQNVRRVAPAAAPLTYFFGKIVAARAP